MQFQRCGRKKKCNLVWFSGLRDRIPGTCAPEKRLTRHHTQRKKCTAIFAPINGYLFPTFTASHYFSFFKHNAMVQIRRTVWFGFTVFHQTTVRINGPINPFFMCVHSQPDFLPLQDLEPTWISDLNGRGKSDFFLGFLYLMIKPSEKKHIIGVNTKNWNVLV